MNILLTTIIMTQPLMSNEVTYSNEVKDLNAKYIQYIEEDFKPVLIVVKNDAEKTTKTTDKKNTKFNEFKEENKKVFNKTSNLVKDIIKSNMRG